MTSYRIIEFDEKYFGPFNTRVHCFLEWWDTLEFALNDLAERGWLVDEYVYGPLWRSNSKEQLLIGVIMRSDATTNEEEDNRLLSIWQMQHETVTKRLEETDDKDEQRRLPFDLVTIKHNIDSIKTRLARY